MRKKYIFSFTIFIIALLLVGCSYKGSNSNTNNINFRTGNQGLFMEFMQNLPPYRIYEYQPLDLMVKYTNKGAYDIKAQEGVIYISGYDPTYLSGLYSQNGELSYYSFSIVGKSAYNPYGEIYDAATFKDDTGPTLPIGVDTFTMTFKATACYMYETLATAKVCIDPNPANINIERSVCQVHDVSLGTQGAPIAVTRVEEQINRNDVIFWIYFKNVGSGDVFVKEDEGFNNIQDCHSNLGFDDLNKVMIVNVEMSDIQLTCKPDSLVQRIGQNGVGQMMCICTGCVKQELEDSYETLLTINLRYGYRDSLIKSVEVRRNP